GTCRRSNPLHKPRSSRLTLACGPVKVRRKSCASSYLSKDTIEGVMAAIATQGSLTGLPRRLVQDGIVSEEDLLAALEAVKDQSGSLVSYLGENRLGSPRQIAVAAAHEFGVPLLDLDAIEPDLDVVRLVDDKLLTKHRVLPILQRGKRLYVAVGDPTNLHALDEIKFQTTLRVEPIVVEQDKLEARVAR